LILSSWDVITINTGDGIFDQMNNEDVIASVWMTTRDTHKCQDIHFQCGLSVDMVIKSSLVRKTLDNVTCVMIAFENFQNILFESKFDTKPLILKKQNTKPITTLYSKNDNISKRVEDSKKNGFYVDMNTYKNKENKRFSYEK
jgi:serine/threonine protein phosphatase PrpC